MEATAKLVIQQHGEIVSDKDKMPTLVNKASLAAGIHPSQVPTGVHRDQIVRILGELKGITQSLAELRNDVGDGHGSTQVAKDVTTAHGYLAARAAIAWCAFILDVTSKP